ncbi:MAG TPA: sulfatase-like hydrolase/transferase [Tepidisphaeraceae bacterium]|jgi:choline-sulfatase|nr:sulfatase-like hydrolase/transferase [Tepidisphaeraceae bacterium]
MSLPTSSLPRRDFLKATAAGLTGLALGARPTFGINQQKKQPNILLIMSDEHNPAITGCYGNKVVHTPNIDSLAERGVTFENHYCNSPLCVPSRSSLTAGKYCSRVNVWGLTSELPSADIPSLPRVMNAAGYESFLCGKQHYDYSRRYGFTEVGGDFNKTYKTGKGSRRPMDAITQDHLSERYKDFHTGDHGKPVEHDRRVTKGAVEFLSKRQATDKPFFLFAGYLAPHFPLIVPQEFYDRYQGKVDMPAQWPEGFFEGLPLNYKLLRAAYKEIGVPDATVLKGRELYYGLTDWVDNEIGKVLATLRANKELADNTVIIYTSDHGENMGEHGMWWKSCMYEQAARVPMVISWPERFKPGQRRGPGASAHLDLVKTVAEIGGGETPDDWNGDSMVPWLENPSHQWKDFAVSEYYAHSIASGFVMARTGKWKYNYHSRIDNDHGPVRELYDLTTDPHEFTNLATQPEHTTLIADIHQRMVKEVGRDPDETELIARHDLHKGYDRKDPPPPGKHNGDE